MLETCSRGGCEITRYIFLPQVFVFGDKGIQVLYDERRIENTDILRITNIFTVFRVE